MRAVVSTKELRDALRTVRHLGRLSGRVRFAAEAELLVEGEEFGVRVPCDALDPGEGTIDASVFARLLKVLSTFQDSALEIAVDGEVVRFGSFSLPVVLRSEPDGQVEEPSGVSEAPPASPRRQRLQEAVSDGWDVWSKPERLDAVRALGQALLDADAGLSAFDVTPDEVLDLVARKIGTSDIARLRGLVQAATKKHPWPQRE